MVSYFQVPKKADGVDHDIVDVGEILID